MLPLTLACGNYDRVAALRDGRIRPEGVELNVLPLRMPESAFRMLHHREFDASEMSLGWYVRARAAERPGSVGIPVFPSRMFRHSSVYVNVDSGIDRPEDLVGKRVGCPEYQMTAAVWMKGILADHHGVPVDSVSYFTGGLEEPGRQEVELGLPERFRVQNIGSDRTLSAMLEAGEIDALYTAQMPSPFIQRSPRVRRLFEEPEVAEVQYFQKTGIYPIMHLIVVRQDIHETHPWVAQSLVKAFDEAKAVAYQEMYDTAAHKYMLPWLALQAENARAALGADDFWPYGVEPNRVVLETFLRYVFEQGLTPRLVTLDELFAPSTVHTSRI
ncbi:ABC transporter substrate-binding protein [Streptomyces lanatus]|uniref:ABC transporter substrate-binding protein n=1 Tax=Streptomyces lanatus TaxID=66900 RepID=A0ABV1Y623_9ACTN|nr:ABC transporter substrate-binding protein [Streptomyces lanatus]GHH30346.1 4,5-dihydroxyphthalate decarboxylase [Streptomyces lanatus]